MGEYTVRFVYEQYFVQVSAVADSEREAIEIANSIVPLECGEPLEIECELTGEFSI